MARRAISTPLLQVAAASLLAACTGLSALAQDVAKRIDDAIAGPHRPEKNRVRDIHRHPRETLLFFGLRPEMTVVEIWPAAGWYTEIIAPVLRGAGRYYAAHVAHEDPDIQGWQRESKQDFIARYTGKPDLYGDVVVTSLKAPKWVDIAPATSADLVLTFRNVHNWTAAGNDEAMFRTFFETLKAGGVLGVVEHRAKEGTSREQMIKTGYMTESYVIALAEKAGFRLDARSEVNANPKDTKDHPSGVWSLPPMLRGSPFARDRFVAIGESDRMTLRFRKP